MARLLRSNPGCGSKRKLMLPIVTGLPRERLMDSAMRVR